MLSYRHGYHAGNHADILKHMTLCVLMRSLLQKDKPFTLIDTHAGAGLYALNSTFAQKNNEYETGLSKILTDSTLNKLVPEFYQTLTAANQPQSSNRRPSNAGREVNAQSQTQLQKQSQTQSQDAPQGQEPTQGQVPGQEQGQGQTQEPGQETGVKLFGNTGRPELQIDFAKLQDKLDNQTLLYPGSPYFETYLSRRNDTVFLSDLHKGEFESLREIFKRQRKVHIELQDGLNSLKALLPPVKKRGLILIDPSYEMKSDYYNVVKAVKEGHARFNQGIFAVWYPVLSRMQDHSKNLVQDLRRLNLPLLQVELCVTAQGENFGMCGSGMLVVNYPFQLEQTLEPIVGELYSKLCDPENGGAKLTIINEKA